MAQARCFVSPARVFARPTADQIWLGPAQQAALGQLLRDAAARILVGPASSGKSTLLNHLAAQLGTDSVVLHCRGPKKDPAAVLAGLLLSADLAPWELSETEQRNLFAVFVQQRRSQKRRVVLVVDDAHRFTGSAWEEIERLLAFRIDRKPAIEMLLAGPPSLATRIDIDRAGLEANQITVHALAPPADEHLASYVEWRLGRFEMAELVTPEARAAIAQLSARRFGAADVLCQMSLLLLRQVGGDQVDEALARRAAATLAARQGPKPPAPVAVPLDAPHEAPPQGYLLISRGGKVTNRITLGQRTLLGRSEHNDVCLASPYLSRHHAAIVGTPEGYYVVDLNSVNGLQLNGRPVARAVLCDQDILSIGPFRLKMQIPDWLAHGNPLPEAQSLADTAIMPPQRPLAPSAMRRVK